ncbi:MAG: hypothetical protein QM764_17720 [Chitinophagaceae bacterium]
MSLRTVFVSVFLIAAFASGTPAHARDLDYERLSDSLERLTADPKLGTLAPMQVERARAALQALKEGGRKERPYLIYVAERRIDIARVSAEAEAAETDRVALQRENDQLELAAARRDAEQARRELEQQRLQAQIRAEEAERSAQEAEAARAQGEEASQAAEAAREEATQAKRMADLQAKAAALAKKEAELSGAAPTAPAKPSAAEPKRMTLADNAFARGDSTLAKAGTARIGAVVDFVNAVPGSRVRIDASVPGNATLARARADAVRDALVSDGIAADRIRSAGSGKGKISQVEIRLEGAN